MDTEQAPHGIDPTVPSVARIYDFLLGGKDNFASDRAAAEKLLQLTPNVREGVQENRRFLKRVVQQMAASGIRQFLDIGAGLPTQENVHQVALAAAPDSRIVYVDNDPIVLTHGRALLADNPQTIVVDGDMLRPESILDNPEVTGHLDFGKPIGLLMLAVVHFIPEQEDAERIVATLRDRLVPGSALAMTHLTSGDLDEQQVAEGRAVYTKAATGLPTPRTHAQVLRFFDGFELAPPGLVRTREWLRDEPDDLPALPGVDGYAGIGFIR
ncbi:O-methyltransferase involved in polyketide biosynthesis [Thermocatellispora tengchongensis]|uniref:O-methyltransferase involved in polyketide biosynthesis n=1 Tax=Thermocatellispora tengchongensis TaxID=1073253 RepID=A0A840P5P2_9ACTN|nr:SAM-dependent methyltransferase [Thermocatellispora tengchongensis]MBB5131335.1 O-methyltransferase involved in polyketide biosynthesis [Thermocatellispora tengchongensis]